MWIFPLRDTKSKCVHTEKLISDYGIRLYSPFPIDIDSNRIAFDSESNGIWWIQSDAGYVQQDSEVYLLIQSMCEATCSASETSPNRNGFPLPAQRNLFQILLNQTEIRLYLSFSDSFGKSPFTVPNQSVHDRYNLI